jgi:hypothetical protein
MTGETAATESLKITTVYPDRFAAPAPICAVVGPFPRWPDDDPRR